jgi:phage terminase large subunit-like protein
MSNSDERLKSLKAEAERRRQEAEQKREAEADARRAELGRRHLADFVKAAWPIVEPGRKLIWGMHLDAKCEHLEAVTSGQIRNLVITEPPGCTKSRLIGVFWPAWVWLSWPESRWLFFSNSDELATRESLACRRLLESDWYRMHYPESVMITTDQNTKTWYENNCRGHRQALSIGASVTGKKGDLLVVDDANDAEKVEGQAYRESINRRWDTAIYDRVIDFKTGRRVLAAQRTHKEDLIGHVLATGEFEQLCIPEEFEPARRFVTSIGWTDKRTRVGELLRPDQFGPEQKAAAVKRLGTMGYRNKHQQDPQSIEGVVFKAAWFKRRWRRDPEDPSFVILEDDRWPYRFKLAGAPTYGTADGAASEKKSADFTVMCNWTTTPRGDLLWLGCILGQVEIPDQPKMLDEAFKRFGWKWIGIEAVASNRALFQFAVRKGLSAIECTPAGLDKLAHAQGAIIEAEQGRLWLPAKDAVPDFPFDAVESQLLQFTGTKADVHDDIVDSLSYAVDLKPRAMAGMMSRPPAPHTPKGSMLTAGRR